jgi:hypothetical protein
MIFILYKHGFEIIFIWFLFKINNVLKWFLYGFYFISFSVAYFQISERREEMSESQIFADSADYTDFKNCIKMLNILFVIQTFN